MKSLDELFSGDEGRDELQAVVSKALGLNAMNLGALDTNKLRELFEALPEPVRNVAYQDGLSDVVFLNNARLYLKSYPERYRSILGLKPQKLTPSAP